MGRWLMSAAVLMGTLLGLYREVTVCSAVSCIVISRRFSLQFLQGRWSSSQHAKREHCHQCGRDGRIEQTQRVNGAALKAATQNGDASGVGRIRDHRQAAARDRAGDQRDLELLAQAFEQQTQIVQCRVLGNGGHHRDAKEHSGGIHAHQNRL